MSRTRVVVVGGGASGMVAAITAARNGADVTLVERKETLGKKILATGNGRCNFTNRHLALECYRSDSDPDVFVADVLGRYGTIEILRFFSQLGVLFKERGGYYYPITEQSSTIVAALQEELIHLAIPCMLDTEVVSIKKENSLFVLYTTSGELICDKLILTTGGKAYEALGSNGSGYELAYQMKHKIVPVVPALVALKGKGKFYKKLAGIRTEAKVSAFVDEQEMASDLGELQMTAYGISGIPVFQISRFISYGLQNHKCCRVEIDFMPHRTEVELYEFLKERKEQFYYRYASQFLLGILKDKLASFFLYLVHMKDQDLVKDIEDDTLKKMARIMKSFSVEITETKSFDEAQVCAGGVSLCEVNSETMESMLVKGLYFAGELLDVDGICGGYNLQWAWATGIVAGNGVNKEHE